MSKPTPYLGNTVTNPLYLPLDITPKFPNPSFKSPLSLCAAVLKFLFTVTVVNAVSLIISHLMKHQPCLFEFYTYVVHTV